MNNQMRYGLGGLIVGGFAVWLITIATVNFNNTGVMRMTGMRGENQNTMANLSAMDAHFIEQMIPHHEDAITMAKLALTKGQRPEVKQLAQNIIGSQSKEIDQMKSWYKDWFGTELPTDTQVIGQLGMRSNGSMHMGMMGDETDIIRLEQGNDFDRIFVEEMIPHHQMAVMMATMLKNGTNRPEMDNLADDIIIAQTKEINQMRQWYKDWGY